MKKINVKGDIIRNDNKWVYNWYGIDATCPKDIVTALEEAAGDEVEVNINSGGGDIFAGSEIYTELRNYKGTVNINIVGLAASAASVIAMAGKSTISPTALFMIHNVSSYNSGDHQVFEKQAQVLRQADQAIANAYKDKTGMSDEELLQLMDNETWMNAEKAVSLKFVDDVMFSKKENVALYNSTSIIKDDVLNKMKALARENDKEKDNAMAKINLLKMKGDYRNEI